MVSAFDIEKSLYTERLVAGTRFSTSAIPIPSERTIRASSATATEMLGSRSRVACWRRMGTICFSFWESGRATADLAAVSRIVLSAARRVGFIYG